MKRYCLPSLILVLSLSVALSQLQAEPSNEATSLTVTYANGEKVKLKGRRAPLPALGIGAGETVGLRLDLPDAFRNIPLVVQALDGGALAQQDFAPGNGKVTTAFQCGAQPGLYRLLLSGGEDRTVTVRFWVTNSANPAVTATAISGGAR